MNELLALGSELGLRIARASLEGAVVIGLVAALCRFAPSLPAAFRCTLWWLASAKLLLSLAPLPALSLPLLPPPETSRKTLEAPAAMAFSAGSVPAAIDPGQSPKPPASGPGSADLVALAVPVLGWAWLALALAAVVRAGTTVADLRRRLAAGEAVADGAVTRGFRSLALRLGLVPPPQLRASAAIDTPQAVGLLRPTVLLPAATWRELAPAELEMTLCHELVHLRRRDLWLGLVPALAEKLFFFHPLAAHAARQYVFAREEACDAEVLRVLGSAPRDYGRMLVRWSAHLRETGLAAAGVASPAPHLKRRLLMLQSPTPSRRGLRAAAVAAAAAMVVALVPYRIVAQNDLSPAMPWLPASPMLSSFSDETAPTPSATPAPQPARPQAAPRRAAAAPAPAPEPAPAVAPTPAGEPVPVVAPTPEPPRPGAPRPVLAPPAPTPRVGAVPAPGAVPAVAGVPAPTPVPSSSTRPVIGLPGKVPMAPAPPTPPPAPTAVWDGDEGLVILSSDHRRVIGSSQDAKAARRHQRGGEPLLYYRRAGSAWVIRDPALVQQAESFFEPMSRLGEEMGKLGAGQGRHGARQGELGARQAEIGVKQAEIGLEMARRTAELSRLAFQSIEAEGAEERRLEGEQRRLEAEIDALAERMEALGREQEQFGAQQEALGEEQEELGREMEKLGEQMERLAEEAQQRLAGLVDRAVANGTAEKVE